MGDLTSLHAQSMRLILMLRQGLERLETSEVAADVHAIQITPLPHFTPSLSPLSCIT